MRAALKVFLGVIAVVLVLAVGLLLYLRFGDPGVYRDDLEAALSEASGFDVTLGGALNIRLAKKLDITATDVTFVNPSLPDDALATLGGVRVVIDTWSLIRGPVRIDAVGIGDARIDLRADSDGGNWSVSRPARSESESGAAPVLERAVLVNVDIGYRSGDDEPRAGSVQKLELRRNVDGSYASGLEATLADGERVVPFSIKGQLEVSEGAASLDDLEIRFVNGDGAVSGSLGLRADAGQYALETSLTISDFRPGSLLSEGQDPATLPPVNADLELRGRGESLKDIMASANGRLSGRQGEGQLDLQAISVLFADLVTSVLRTLNPLVESRTYTNLDCGIYEIVITEGVATIERFAAQSDRLTVVGSGEVRLDTEEIDLVLNTKSREGLGLSIGDIANSFLKIGGTIREPSLGVDAAGSLTTTGAAVATGGLSVLARGLWDRVSSEVDICKDAAPGAE